MAGYYDEYNNVWVDTGDVGSMDTQLPNDTSGAANDNIQVDPNYTANPDQTGVSGQSILDSAGANASTTDYAKLFKNFLSGNAGTIGAGVGLASLLGGNKSTTGGYAGTIPHYTASREQIPHDDTGRRPGSAGRSYFTDTVFTPSTATPGGIIDTGVGGTNTATGIKTPLPVIPKVPTGPTTQDIQSWLKANPTATDAQIAAAMQQYKVTPEQMAAATGIPLDQIKARYASATNAAIPDITAWFKANPGATDAQIAAAMDQFHITPDLIAAATGVPLAQVKSRYDTAKTAAKTPAAPTVSQSIQKWFVDHPNSTDTEIAKAMNQYGITTAQLAEATGAPLSQVQARYDAAMGIGSLPSSSGTRASDDSSSAAPTGGITSADIQNWLGSHAGASDATIAQAMQDYGVSAAQMAAATGLSEQEVQDRMSAAGYAKGGIAGGNPRYLRGSTDGMADKLDTSIDGTQPAKLSHGEFVVPADVVSHLGNGNSDAGAKKLYSMMDKVRMARTGTKKQGKEINPDKFLPGGKVGYAGGGIVSFASGGTTQATDTTLSSTLSPWAGDYVTNMLGKGQALSEMPYQAYTGPLTAGPSAIQQNLFSGLGSMQLPENYGKTFSSTGAYQAPNVSTSAYNVAPIGTGTSAGTTGAQSPGVSNTGGPTGIAAQYMNPYLQGVLDPQLAELRRQNDITQMKTNAGLTSQGAFGGGRQAIMNAENNRNLMQEMNKTVGQGYANAYDKAMQQFNTEQTQGQNLASTLASAGATQRDIEQQGITADLGQFTEQRDYPYKMVQYQQGLLQGLPISTSTSTANVSPLTSLLNTAGGATQLATLLKNLGVAP